MLPVRYSKVLRSLQPSFSTLRRGFAGEAVAVGINIKKGGADPPLKPDEEYPAWVQNLATAEQSLYELQRKIEATGEESLTLEEATRYVKLDNRATVKERNALRAKK